MTAPVGTRIAVLGAGSWGTALANHLARAGHPTTLWDRNAEVLRSIRDRRENSRFFPGIELHPSLCVEEKIRQAVEGRDVVVFAVPSAACREVAKQLFGVVSTDMTLVSVAKGLEASTLLTMSGVLAAEFLHPGRIAVLSGPSFAREVLLGLPTAVTVASVDRDTAKRVARLFHHGSFRVYTSDDVIGVELGGVVKNVIALAAGIIDGAGMGANARAALITRGLVEMQRLATAMGGKPQTITGLSGLGDLFLTATGDSSRNRQVGMRLGRGEKLDEIMEGLGQCAEGVLNAQHLYELATRENIEAPIIEEIAKFLSGSSSLEQGLENLLSRPARDEE